VIWYVETNRLIRGEERSMTKKKIVNQRVAYCTLFRRSRPNSRDCRRTSMSVGCTRLWPFGKWTHPCCTLVSLKSQQNKTFVYRFMQIMMVMDADDDSITTILLYNIMIVLLPNDLFDYACMHVWMCVRVCYWFSRYV